MNDFFNIWNRRGESTMSKNLYVFSMFGFTTFAIFISFWVAQFTLTAQISLWGFLLVLALGIAGVVIANTSNVPFLSFTGLMLVAIPYGALLGPIINSKVQADVVEAFFVTTLYTGVFGLIGAVIPDNLEHWSRWILSALIIALLGYFIIPIGGFFGVNITHALGLWDWAIVALFGLIIMYDSNRAMRIPQTLDNAIDSALAFYLDWFNVYIRYLNNRGRSRD